MKRCSSVPLATVICTLPVAEKQQVLLEFRGYLDQLRALEPPRPGGKVGSTDYGPLEDLHLSRGGEPCGPFEDVIEFHKASRDGVEKYPTGNAELDELILAQESRDYSIKFTHGDLARRHIFYADGKVTAIIDWEFAGWLPDYWKYMMCWGFLALSESEG